ncbi:GAF domain-containing protein [Pseudoduganella sp. FT25W]|uniref:histidine kinase n=1 Tax=Duganella alba TaxID=2666081 RepID=A0A6L5QDN1_9BURK|nr:GAF domain-containing sensor histidine kinase [Duganella alba]MRX07866.1 GAF domain-containing protein [Duganella alba]MRX15469.1 GAF domain-containing protein [Duganella alba]
MTQGLDEDIAAIARIGAVPTILEAVSELTGLGFVAIARVTANSWHCCSVLDKLNFGLQIGGELDVTTTLCEEVRDNNAAIIIDSVRDSERYCNHHTPRIYGFQSYFSIPLYRPSGEYFGTLCGLDPHKAELTNKTMRNTLMLFAELISRQLESEVVLGEAQAALSDEVKTAKMREQFIAMLGHDIRTPLSTIMNGTEILRMQAPPSLRPLLDIMQRSSQRIGALIDDVTDFTRGRMGGGISLNLRHESQLEKPLQQAIAELRSVYPQREIIEELPGGVALLCDAARLVQLLSNLLKNALVHGSAAAPVYVKVRQSNGIFEMSVTNSGPPIPAEIQAQLFTPFWQSSSGGGSGGLGLGLFIASEIAVSHGGVLEVASSDTATTFTYRSRTAEFVERRALTR